MIAKINQLLQEVEALKAANPEELEALRIKYLSKKGAINDLMADLPQCSRRTEKRSGYALERTEKQSTRKDCRLEGTVRKPGYWL